MKENIFENKMYRILLLITVVAISQPLFNILHINVGDDTRFHIYRIKEIEEAIKLFRFPMYIGNIGNFNSIDPIFYPNLFLYIPAIINVVIKNINISYNIYKIMVIFGYVTISYYSVYIISKDKFVSTLFSISYSTNYTILNNIFIRDAAGEYIALMFLPLFLASLYNIYIDEGDKWFNLVIAGTFILQSHIITTFYLSIFTIVACLILIKKTLTKRIFIRLFESIVLIFFINIWFIIPFLSNYFDKLVGLTQDNNTIHYIAEFGNLFTNHKHLSSFYVNNYSSLVFFYLLIIGILISCFSNNCKNMKEYKIGLTSFVIFCFYFLLTFKNPLTDLVLSNDFLHNLYAKQQFSIRIVNRSIPFLLLSFTFLLSTMFKHIEEKCQSISERFYSLWEKIEKAIKILLLISILLISMVFAKNKSQDANIFNYIIALDVAPENIYGFIEYDIFDEDYKKNRYKHIQTKSIDKYDAVKVSSSEIKVNSCVKKGLEFTINYEINNFDSYGEYFIDIPFRNYKHFVVRDSKNNIISSYYGQDKKNIRVKLTKNADTIHIYYKIPIIWSIAKWVSIFTIITLLFHKRLFSFFKCEALNKNKLFAALKNSVQKIRANVTTISNKITNSRLTKNILVVLAILIIVVGIRVFYVKFGYKNNAWNKDKKGWFYLDKNGKKLKNQWVDTKYYVGPDGYMVTNDFINEDGKLFYVGEDGEYIKNSLFRNAETGFLNYADYDGIVLSNVEKIKIRDAYYSIRKNGEVIELNEK